MEKKLMSVVLIAALMSASCTSYKAIRPPNVESGLKQGDVVRIVTKDGRDVKFTVVAISSEAILGEDQRILFSDIDTLERQQVSPAKTAGLIGGILAAAFVALLIYAAQSLGPYW